MNNKLQILDIHPTERAIDTIAVPWETDYAALVPRFTGSLSAISSALIIYVIMRSQTRLSSIYHRIMFGMSLADICGSLAMALTSLPMPSYMPKEEEFGYHWAGTRLGNTYTCNAQGFFATFGMVSMFNYNAMLCLYYACAIAFTMRERNIKKYVEPVLLGLPLIVGLGFAITPLFYELYNPGISAFAWCGPQPYPDEECTIDHWEECIRGNGNIKKLLQILISIIIMSDFACIVISLILVIAKVIQTDHVMVQISKIYQDCGNSEMEKVLERHSNTKAVILQASSYIAAFVLGIMPPALLSIGAIQSSGQNGHEVADIFEKITLVLLPLQGFFNFVIFVSHKIYNYRRVHCDVGIGRVIKLLFCTSAHDPYFISRISIVKQYHDDMEEQAGEGENNKETTDAPIAVIKTTSVVYQLDVHDESNDQHQQEELHYRLSFMKKNTHNDDGAALLNVIMIGHHCNFNLVEQQQQQQQQQQDGIRPTTTDTHQEEEEAPMMTSNRVVAISSPAKDFSNPRRIITRTSGDWHVGIMGDDGLSFPSFSSFSSPWRSSEEGSGAKTTSNNNTTHSSRYSDLMLTFFDDNDEETNMMEKNTNIRRHYYK